MDENDEDAAHVFAIPDLYGPSKWLQNVAEQTGLLFSDLRLDDIDKKLPPAVEQVDNEDVFFKIPDFSLDSSDIPAIPPLCPEFSQNIPLAPEHVDDDFDIWLLPEEAPIKTANYQSWDSFDDEKHKIAYTSYITEAGPVVFDTAIKGGRDALLLGNSNDPIMDPDVYASSILALGLGRGSVLFSWDGEKSVFVQTIPRMRISGYSTECLDGLLGIFMDCGNTTKSLQRFVERTYFKRKSPGQIALADAVSSLLSTIQSSLSEFASQYRSILQLQVLFQPAHSILTCFQRIVLNTSKTRSDESMLSTIFEEIQLQEHRADSLRDILIGILSRVSHPWLEFISEWLGLQRETGLPLTKEGIGKSFVTVADREWVDEQGIELQERDYVLDYDRVPSFIAPEDARAIFEVGKSLRFLKTHHSEHPLARPDVVASANPPPFEWKFSWLEIICVESKALQYEKDLNDAIQLYSKHSSEMAVQYTSQETLDSAIEFDFFGKPENDMQAHVLASIDALNLPLGKNGNPDRLSTVLSSYLTSAAHSTSEDTSIFSPPIALMPVLAFNPIISAQARIVNGTCMRMFFKSHKLRRHISLQRSFHLLGNGVFLSRLSHALFDPELESAERHRGIARSGGMMGLRLGNRNTWPPASSELRLALMGVLTESYASSQPLDHVQGMDYLEKSLPGDLSFAVRDMSEEEIAKCMKADSMEALDFLRLSYKPPPPLEAIITPMILFKYDQLFKLLLRVVRMLYVTSALFRDARDSTSFGQETGSISQRFRIEAQHFITSVASYFFDTGIETTWRIFDSKLDEIEARINSDDDNMTLGQNEGLDKLRDYHERVLDKIMFALLLRKRQQPVMQLLEEIFAVVLQFSKHSRQRALRIDGGDGDKVRDMYLRFRMKVGVFITVCRGLSEKGYGEKKAVGTTDQGGLFDVDDLVEENTILHLLARLEMSNYYSKTAM